MSVREGLKSVVELKTWVKKLKRPINECSKSTYDCSMPVREGLKSVVELKTSVKKLKTPINECSKWVVECLE